MIEDTLGGGGHVKEGLAQALPLVRETIPEESFEKL